MEMIRKSIYLTHEQSELLRVLAFEQRTTESHLIRDALDKYLAKEKKKQADK